MPGSTVAAPCRREHEALLERAASAERAAGELDRAVPGADRARRILAGLADACRAAAGVFDADPTLADEPWQTGRFRKIDVLAELGRHLPILIRHCLSDRNLDRWPRQDRWDEAEALYARVGALAEEIVREVPRRDHATVEGLRAISRGRLAVRAGDLHHAAEMVRAALTDAARLPHPTPEIEDLQRLADSIDAHVGAFESGEEIRRGD